MPTTAREPRRAHVLPGRGLRRGPFSLRRTAAEAVRCFEEHDLLTSSSAIAFQILTALVPLLLFAFALLGFLNLSSVWHTDVAPQVRANVSPAAFTVIDSTVTQVLTARQLFWMTAGLALAIWQISGAVRAVMGALRRIYGIRRDRPWRRRMIVSFALSIAVGAALLVATAVVTVTPLIYGRVGQPLAAVLFVLRWGTAAALMLIAVGLLLRYGPPVPRPIEWVSFGTVLISGAWVLASIGFGAYLKFIASYQSVFGNLATVVVLMGYIYLSALVFLAGAQVDAIVREQLDGDA